MKRPSIKENVAKQRENFFYKKPSLSFEVNQSYGTMNTSRHINKSRDIVSKTKTTSKITLNNSTSNPNGKQSNFEKKNSSQILKKRITMISPNRSNLDKSQVNKLSPRSLMNVKSKEILFKSFTRDFNAATKGIEQIITRENVLYILNSMGYLKETYSLDSQNNGSNKYVDYLIKLSKEMLSNLKILLICIESFYQLYKYFGANMYKKQSSKTSDLKGYFDFSKKSLSPECNENKPNGIKILSGFNSRCFSPKSSLIKYDSMNHIIDIPEEYEEFLRRKFSRLNMNRSTKKKNEVHNLPIINQNLSASSSCTKQNTSNSNKENEQFESHIYFQKESVLNQRKATLKSLTKTLLAKEFSKRNSKNLEIDTSINSNCTKLNDSKIKTPKTCNLKQSQSTSTILLKNSSKMLFQKVFSKTPKANKFSTVAQIPK